MLKIKRDWQNTIWLKRGKSIYTVKEVEFLWKKFQKQNGAITKPSQEILNYNKPNKKQLMRFLVLLNYDRLFVKNLLR